MEHPVGLFRRKFSNNHKCSMVLYPLQMMKWKDCPYRLVVLGIFVNDCMYRPGSMNSKS